MIKIIDFKTLMVIFVVKQVFRNQCYVFFLVVGYIFSLFDFGMKVKGFGKFYEWLDFIDENDTLFIHV